MPPRRRKPPNPMCTGNGGQCGHSAIDGGTVCWDHGGAAPQVAAKAAVRAAAAEWGPTDTKEDPGDVLLRLVAQSARRVALYADLLQEQYERAAAGDIYGDDLGLPSNVRALIGHKFALSKAGDPVPIEEAIRGLVELEGIERDRCAGFAAKAIAAGLAERQVRLAEKQGEMMAEVLRAVLADTRLGLSPGQCAAVPGLVREHLALLPG